MEIGWRVGRSAGFHANVVVLSKGCVYDSDLDIGEPWDKKRVVVMKCTVLEELICLAQEIEGAVEMIRGMREESGEVGE